MKYALISDIHANLPALEAVLADLDAHTDIDAIYHLGDLVGYAPWPDEVVSLLRERAIPGVAGNYDSTTASDYKHCGCKYEDARQEELSHLSYEWTRANASADTKQFLGSLPFRIDVRPLGGHLAGPRLILLHGNPVLNTVYWTEHRSDRFCLQMAENVSAKSGDVIAFGHTHKPWHREIPSHRRQNAGVGRNGGIVESPYTCTRRADQCLNHSLGSCHSSTGISRSGFSPRWHWVWPSATSSRYRSRRSMSGSRSVSIRIC